VTERRRWIDGPRWHWLCRLVGHQKRAWAWYSYCGLGDAWHRHALYLMSGGGQICLRCGSVIAGPDPQSAQTTRQP
jgi:hypothetical protein